MEFRWNKPKHENGVLTRFEIFYQISNQSTINKTLEDWITANVTPSVTSFQLEGMSPGYIVSFQVRAHAGVAGLIPSRDLQKAAN